jgi:UDP-N-acetylmuramoyl-tripeptide--D-alanyl-D-alanine ligase
VVAGEMLELGSSGGELHCEAGRQIARLGVSLLIGVRGLAEEMIRGAREEGMNANAAVFASTPEEAATILIPQVRSGDLILVKGSRGVKTEIVVQRIKQTFERLTNSGETRTGDAATGKY